MAHAGSYAGSYAVYIHTYIHTPRHPLGNAKPSVEVTTVCSSGRGRRRDPRGRVQVEAAGQSELVSQLIASEDKLQTTLINIDALQDRNHVMALQQTEINEQRRLLNSALTGNEHGMKVKLMEMESLKGHVKQLVAHGDHLAAELATVKMNRDRMKGQLSEANDALQRARTELEARCCPASMPCLHALSPCPAYSCCSVAVPVSLLHCIGRLQAMRSLGNLEISDQSLCRGGQIA